MAERKKALGRGLDSIFGSNVEQFLDDIQNNTSDLPGRRQIELKISEIRPNPYQPRKEFDPKALNELADSIRLHRETGLPLAAFSYYVVAPKGWGPQLAGRGWHEIAALPWIWTPPDSVHHRLLATKFSELGVAPNAVAEVDQEASMLDLVRSGVGLTLARDSIALRESQAHGLALAPGLSIEAELAFITLAARREEPMIAASFDAVRAAFG